MTQERDLFHGNVAWCTKGRWAAWHFYYNSSRPFCGSLRYGLLTNKDQLLIEKQMPKHARCSKCIANGVRAGLWKDETNGN